MSEVFQQAGTLEEHEDKCEETDNVPSSLGQRMA